jgi:preprotein translocase subunit SecG
MRILLTIVFVVVCLALLVLVLMQEGKTQGLGAISGIADTYWGKNKARSMEGRLERVTIVLSVLFYLIALLLNMKVF